MQHLSVQQPRSLAFGTLAVLVLRVGGRALRNAGLQGGLTAPKKAVAPAAPAARTGAGDWKCV